MLTFDFGRSDADDTPIARRLREGAGPSLSLTVPLFVFGLVLGVLLALFVAFFRETYIDRAVLVLCMLTMSVAGLLYIIAGQYLIGMLLRWFPISGFDPDPPVVARFLALPVLVGVVSGFGADVRLYRTIFLEEIGRDYVRTARAKGCGDARVMLRHVLRNALIPILTNIVVAIPFLFTGALLLESFFGIPGLGALTVEAIQGNDFSTLRTMVYLGALLFIARPDPHRHQLCPRRSPRAARLKGHQAWCSRCPNLLVVLLLIGGASGLARVMPARDRFWRENARPAVAPPADRHRYACRLFVGIGAARLDCAGSAAADGAERHGSRRFGRAPSSTASSSRRASRRRAIRRRWPA